MVVQLVRDVIDGRRDSSAGDLLRSVSPVVLTLIIVSILAGLATGIGLLLLIVPGLYLLTIWSVIAPVVVVEQPGVFESFGRSRALVRGNGWQVFGVIVLVVVLLLVVGIVTAILIDAVGDAGGSAIGWALNVVTAPITALVGGRPVLRAARRPRRARPPGGRGAVDAPGRAGHALDPGEAARRALRRARIVRRVPSMWRPRRVTARMRTRKRPAGRPRRSTTAVRRLPVRTGTACPWTETETGSSVLLPSCGSVPAAALTGRKSGRPR